MPRIKEELIKEKLATQYPDITFKFWFYGLLKFKSHAIGITDDKIYLMKLSNFRMKFKGEEILNVADINDITFERGDIKGTQAVMVITTTEKKYTIMTNWMVGYDPLEQAEPAYKFLFEKLAK